MRKIARLQIAIYRRLVFGSIIAAVLSGCGASLPEVQTGSLQTGSADSMPGDAATFAGKPAAIYAHIAKGAHSCWLGPGRALHETHQFHAEALPASKGGRATIVIYQRGAKAKPKQRRAAMRILITPASNTHSKVAVINRRFPAETARRMGEEVIGWANGNPDCLAARPANSAAEQKSPPARQ